MNSANNTSQSNNYLAELDDDSDSSVQFVDVGDSVKSSTPKPLNLKEPTPSMNTNRGKRTAACKALTEGAHSDIIDLEREKLVIKRQSLEIEQSRLDIERERLGVEKDILASLTDLLSRFRGNHQEQTGEEESTFYMNL
jgi:hypothetical protein